MGDNTDVEGHWTTYNMFETNMTAEYPYLDTSWMRDGQPEPMIGHGMGGGGDGHGHGHGHGHGGMPAQGAAGSDNASVDALGLSKHTASSSSLNRYGEITPPTAQEQYALDPDLFAPPRRVASMTRLPIDSTHHHQTQQFLSPNVPHSVSGSGSNSTRGRTHSHRHSVSSTARPHVPRPAPQPYPAGHSRSFSHAARDVQIHHHVDVSSNVYSLQVPAVTPGQIQAQAQLTPPYPYMPGLSPDTAYSNGGMGYFTMPPTPVQYMSGNPLYPSVSQISPPLVSPLEYSLSNDALSTKPSPPASLKRGQACGFCRRRKLRCSGERPACTSCIKYKKACEYTVIPDRTQWTRVHSNSNTNSNNAEAHGHGLAPPSGAVSHQYEHAATGHHVILDEQHDAQQQQHQQATDDYEDRLYADFINFVDADELGPSTTDVADGGLDPPPSLSHTSSAFAPYSSGSVVASEPVLRAFATSPPRAPDTIADSAHSGSKRKHSLATETAPSFEGYRDDRSSDGSSPTAVEHRLPILQVVTSVSGDSALTPDLLSTSSLTSPAGGIKSAQHLFDPKRASLEIPLSLKSPVIPHSHSRSRTTSPDVSNPPPPAGQLPHTAEAAAQWDHPPPASGALFSGAPAQGDPMEGLVDRLGEFLFFPRTQDASSKADGSGPKRRRASEKHSNGKKQVLNPAREGIQEPDGLNWETREALLDTFFPCSRLFFEMSIPRFKNRLSYTDHRRPALAILNAMYLWATRFAGKNDTEAEERFFQAGYKGMSEHSNRPDRILDQIRAGFLLTVYVFGAGRFHEAYVIHGMAMRLVISTGLHCIPSCVLSEKKTDSKHPLLRQRAYLFPPPEDRLELAERIHAFWAIFSVQRMMDFATSFPWCLRDEDVTTPFPRSMADIASGIVTETDDVTVLDLYRPTPMPEGGTQYSYWVKTVILMERAAKLSLLDPEAGSDYAQAMSPNSSPQARMIRLTESDNSSSPSSSTPISLVEVSRLYQAKHRRPTDYQSVKFALDQLLQHMGEHGVYPLDQWKKDQQAGAKVPSAPNLVILIHHMICAAYVFLYDVDSLEDENEEALRMARRSVALISEMPEMPISDVDSLAVQVWAILSRTLIKEIRRLLSTGQVSAAEKVKEEVMVYVNEAKRVGALMSIARSLAAGVEKLLQSVYVDHGSLSPGSEKDVALPSGE